MSRAETARETVETLSQDLRHYAQQASEVVTTIQRSQTDITRRVAEQLVQRGSAVRAAELAFEQCRAGEDKRDCGQEAKAVQQAHDGLERAESVHRRITNEFAQLQASVRTFSSGTERILDEARQQLTGTSTDLARYLGSSALSGASSSPAPSHGGGGPDRPAGTAGLPPGFAMISIDDIVDGEGAVTSDAQFTKGYSPADLEWAHNAFLDVVLPTLAAGGTIDDLRTRDAAEGRMGTRSYADTYAGFLGGDALVAERAPGGYTLGNGYHRLYVARHMGLRTVPARIVG